MWFKHLKFQTHRDNLSTLLQKHTFDYYKMSEYANRADYTFQLFTSMIEWIAAEA